VWRFFERTSRKILPDPCFQKSLLGDEMGEKLHTCENQQRCNFLYVTGKKQRLQAVLFFAFDLGGAVTLE